jgi:hypothetical protein
MDTTTTRIVMFATVTPLVQKKRFVPRRRLRPSTLENACARRDSPEIGAINARMVGTDILTASLVVVMRTGRKETSATARLDSVLASHIVEEGNAISAVPDIMDIRDALIATVRDMALWEIRAMTMVCVRASRISWVTNAKIVFQNGSTSPSVKNAIATPPAWRKISGIRADVPT